MTNLPILYSFVRCPYAMRARIALIEANMNCILREVNLKNKPSHMLEISPKGTVPVLCFTDNSILEESLDVVHHALKLSDEEKQQQKLIAQIINSNDTEFVKLLRPYKYPDRYPQLSALSCRQKIENRFLDKYEKMLEGKLFLLGIKKSLLDIAILPFIRQLSLVDQEWFFNSKYKNTISWLKIFTESDAFSNIVMAKHKPWVANSTPVYLLTE